MSSSYLMFCGSYTDFDVLAHLPKTKKAGQGVYCYHFHDGEIKLLNVVPVENPAVLSFHPDNANTIYVLSEGIKENGLIHKVQYTYECNPGTPQRVDTLKIVCNEAQQRTGGKSLCYFSVDPATRRYGVAINYWDGSADVYKLSKDDVVAVCKRIDHMALTRRVRRECGDTTPRRQVVNREDHWHNRQVGPHAHSAHFFKNWVFIPDLGENCVFQYGWNPDKNVILEYEAQTKLVEGAGPRHMVFHPTLKVAYVSNELNSSITVLAVDDSEPEQVKCRLKMVQTVNTDKDMKTDEDVWKKNYVAEIGLSRDGRFVYCSNRGYDTIAIFRVLLDQNGKLEPVSFVSTFGQTPRHFAITPDDKYLIGANQDSNNLAVFKRDLQKGTLQLLHQYDNIAAPNYVLFSPFAVGRIGSKL